MDDFHGLHPMPRGPLLYDCAVTRGEIPMMRTLSSRISIFTVLLAMFGMAPMATADTEGAYLQAMKWRQIGPFRGGRVTAVSGVPGDPTTWYFGAVAGGVWKSTDAGASWKPTFDAQNISSIGAIAIADADPNVIYVGSGEACPRGNISYGDGMYKSLDAGRTWANIGLKDSRHIAAVIVNPQNSDVVLVAALGHAFGPNEERGVFRTADGGKSWNKVLYKDRDTGAIDIASDPTNPNIVYASLWQMRRQPWNFSSGGAGRASTNPPTAASPGSISKVTACLPGYWAASVLRWAAAAAAGFTRWWRPTKAGSSGPTMAARAGVESTKTIASGSVPGTSRM